MKKIILLAMTMLFLSCQSRDEKARRLIKDDLNKTIADFGSYEAVEYTKIDSAFNDPLTDSISIIFGGTLIVAKELAQSSLNDMENSNNQVKNMLVGGNWNDNQYKVLNIEMQKHEEKVERYINLGDLYADSLETRIGSLNSNFIGFKINHKFRYKNKDGEVLLTTYMYVFDPDMKKIVFKKELDNVQEEIDKVILSYKKALK